MIFFNHYTFSRKSMVILLVFTVCLFLRTCLFVPQKVAPFYWKNKYAYFFTPSHFTAFFSPRTKQTTVFRKRIVSSLIFCYTKSCILSKTRFFHNWSNFGSCSVVVLSLTRIKAIVTSGDFFRHLVILPVEQFTGHCCR